MENDSKKFSDQSLRHFLFTLNCNISSDGTKYLADAITLVNENHELLKNMNDIYEIISEKYSISNKTVKWGIRNSIDTMNKNTSNEELCLKLKKQTFRKLTPKYFIPLAISHFNS